MGIAGAKISKAKKGDGAAQGSSAGGSATGGTSKQSGVGIAGDATWNEIDSIAKAYINSEGWLKTAATADVAANASDATSIIACATEIN